MKEKVLEKKSLNKSNDKVVNQKNRRKKLLIVLLLFLFALSAIIIGITLLEKQQYKINKNPKVNIVYIEKLIYESNVCNEDWLKNVNQISRVLKEEADELKNIEITNKDYKERIENFSILHKELANNLEALAQYIKTTNQDNLVLSNLDSDILVKNVQLTYENYKNYYNNEIVVK